MNVTHLDLVVLVSIYFGLILSLFLYGYTLSSSWISNISYMFLLFVFLCFIKYFFFIITRTCGLMVINLKAKIQYGEVNRVRVPVTGKLIFRHYQGHGTDTWQHVTSLDHFGGTRIPLYNSKKCLFIVKKNKNESTFR